jgi:transcriptional regulator with XRE-family HTH domain
MRRLQVNELLAFGMAVRSLRTKANLSQEELAHLVGVHRTYVGSVERGERNVSLKNISAFAAALNCSASELLKVAEQIETGSITSQRRGK